MQLTIGWMLNGDLPKGQDALFGLIEFQSALLYLTFYENWRVGANLRVVAGEPRPLLLALE